MCSIFVCFKQLIFVLLNLIQKAVAVPSKREVMKLYLIGKYFLLFIRHWIFDRVLMCFGNETVMVSVNTNIKCYHKLVDFIFYICLCVCEAET